MTAITSYLRHIIVTAFLLLVEKFRLPVEGSEDAAHAIALILIGTLTWAFVKYAPELARRLGIAALILIPALILMHSCAETPVTGSLFYRHPDSGAKGGIHLTPGGGVSGYVRLPIIDPQTGQQLGMAEIKTPIKKAVIATK
jgi:hypothetical protein